MTRRGTAWRAFKARVTAGGFARVWAQRAARRTTLVGGLILLWAFVTSSFVSAQAWAPATPDVLHLGSLRGPLATEPPAGNTWGVAVSHGYFNVWHYSWHLSTLHRELGLVRRPVSRAELDLLEQRNPGATMHQVDLEGWQGDLMVSRRLAHGLTVTLRVPWMSIGSPNWDRIPEEFHHAVGATSQRREVFARGRSLLFARSPRGRVVALDELDESRLGDVSLALAGPMGRWLSGEHRWVAALEAPTGMPGTLWGSGGWDFGARVESSWVLSRGGSRLGTSVGYSRLDPEGSWLGYRRRDTWHAAACVEFPLTAATQVLLGTRWEQSPIAGFGAASQNSGSWTAAVRRRFEKGRWVAFVLGEDAWGVMPDFSLHLAYGVALP